MTIHNITFDCRDPAALGRFWADALGLVEDPDNQGAEGDDEFALLGPDGHRPGLLFIAVPEPKIVKNRVHLDLWPGDGRELAVERLVALGGRLIDDRHNPDGSGWVVLADPEGNELCVERAPAERGEPLPVEAGERKMPDVRVAGEREILTATLDWYREGIVKKVSGVSARDAGATPLRSASSIAGIVKHVALVEDSWFTVRFAGRADPPPWAGVDWDADRDWEFHTATSEPLAESLALYDVACVRSRTVAAEHELDDIGADTRRSEFSLRWLLVHMIEETARHLGHLDVLREYLDGTTGE
jgi:catechol 2,3-dioxygenase-like lactoylglutathione lyase family enzyme